VERQYPTLDAKDSKTLPELRVEPAPKKQEPAAPRRKREWSRPRLRRILLWADHRNRFFAACCEIVLAPRLRR